jgi:hypothetical protein
MPAIRDVSIPASRPRCRPRTSASGGQWLNAARGVPVVRSPKLTGRPKSPRCRAHRLGGVQAHRSCFRIARRDCPLTALVRVPPRVLFAHLPPPTAALSNVREAAEFHQMLSLFCSATALAGGCLVGEARIVPSAAVCVLPLRGRACHCREPSLGTGSRGASMASHSVQTLVVMCSLSLPFPSKPTALLWRWHVVP